MPTAIDLFEKARRHERLEQLRAAREHDLMPYFRVVEAEPGPVALMEGRERITLGTSPRVVFKTDEKLRLGEFGIQARRVKPPQTEHEAPYQADEGRTMVYSSAERVQEPLREPDPRRGRARLRVDGHVEIVGSKGAVLGRSRDADVVIDDPNVSRHHAEVRPSGGSWIVNDLGSTNGIKVNGRRVDGPQSLKRGDVIEIGTSRVTFELE